MELLKVVKICCNLWLWKFKNRYLAGSGMVDISKHCDEENVKWTVKTLIASRNLCWIHGDWWIWSSKYKSSNWLMVSVTILVNWSWNYLLQKRRMKECSACHSKKNRWLSRSAADIVSLVARRSAIIHWHDEVCGVVCRLACSLTCKAAHVSGGVWHNLTQATYFPREIPFQSVSMKRWFLVN